MPDGQFYGAIIWYHLMAPFYGMCVPGIMHFFLHKNFKIQIKTNILLALPRLHYQQQ